MMRPVVALLVLAACATACRRALPAGEPAAGPAANRAATALPAIPGEIRLEHVPEYVKLAPAEASADASSTTATGKVVFDEERVSRVAAPVSGRVVDLLVRTGDAVKKGQGLLAVASPDAEGAVDDYVSALADQQIAERTLARQKRLYGDQAAALKDVEQAEGDATKAQAALARARGRLRVLGIDPAKRDALSHFVLRSPIAGTVVERPAFPGMEVRADTGAPLVTVADLSRVWVVADVYERDLSRVAKGQRATVRVAAWPSRAFEGQVTHVGDLVDPQTRTLKVRIEVPNAGLLLKPEMFTRVTLASRPGELPVVTVPARAILTDGDTTAVVVALEGGRYQKRVVESGPEADGRVRVLVGLRSGEQVVVDGALYLGAAIEGL